MILCFLPTVPLVSVVAVVVSTGVIIVTVVVIIVCLLIVAKCTCKHRKNSLGKVYTAATASYWLWFTGVVFFFTAPIKHVYLKQPTIGSRFVLSHVHV